MAVPPPGVAFLSAVARLEFPRETAGPVRAVTFDVVLPCPNDLAISPIICSARYIQGFGEHVIQGVYEMLLKVMASYLIVNSLTCIHKDRILSTECSYAEPWATRQRIPLSRRNLLCASLHSFAP